LRAHELENNVLYNINASRFAVRYKLIQEHPRIVLTKLLIKTPLALGLFAKTAKTATGAEAAASCECITHMAKHAT
jgi:hypothetical protein